MTPRDALDRIAAHCDEHGTPRPGGCQLADEVRAILADVCPDVPPGRCGDVVPTPTGDLVCELLAGHAGMHQARQYPADTLSAGTLAYWREAAS